MFIALVSTLGNQFNNQTPQTLNTDWLAWEKRHSYSLLKPKGFSIIPSIAFKGENGHQYLINSGIQISNNDHISFDEIILEKAIMVFDQNGTQINSCIYAQLINQLSALQAQHNRDFLHLHIDIDGIFICAFKNSKLQLANLFTFKAKEDILYYLAATANSFGLSVDNDLVTYSGYLRPKSSLKKLLGEYIGQLKPLTIGAGIQFDTAINPIHQFYYADVFILPLCAL
ncbi:MAG: DUF3822 family protein [Bacteroidia bacterium]